MPNITVDVSGLSELVSIGDSFVGKKREGGAGMLRLVGHKNSLEVSSIGADSQLLVQRMSCITSGAGPFEVLVPPRRFLQILQSIRKETVLITAESNSVKIKSSSGQFRLATESFDTFPAIDTVVTEHSETSMAVSELVASLFHTLPLCDETSTRFALGGVLFDMSPQGSAFVATDCRRILVSKRENVKIGGSSLRFVLPSAIGRSLLSLLKKQDQSSQVRLQLNQNRMSIVGEDFELVTPSVQGRFPDWKSLMVASNGPLVMAAVVGDIKRSCRLANVMTSEEHQGVVFNFGDEIELSSGAGGGDSAVRLVGSVAQEIKTECMAKYVLDAVTGWQDHEVIEWRQAQGDQALYLHLPDEMICCIMPLVNEG